MKVKTLKKYLENFNDETEVYFFMKEVISRNIEGGYAIPITNKQGVIK